MNHCALKVCFKPEVCELNLFIGGPTVDLHSRAGPSNFGLRILVNTNAHTTRPLRM